MNGFRWIARIVGALASVFFIFVIFGQSLDKPEIAPKNLIFLLSIAMVGGLLSWRWERLGASILLVDSIALGLYVYNGGPRDPTTAVAFYGLPFFVPGLLFFICSHENRTG